VKKASKAQLKKVRELLRDKKARDESGLFAAEGRKIVKDMIAKGHPIDMVLVSSGCAGKEDIGFLTEKVKAPVVCASGSDLEKISPLRNSQGIVAVVKKPGGGISGLLEKKTALVALCDGVQDPGNLGAIIRTASALGADAVILAGDAADPYNPKVVRSSSGMVMDIPVCPCGPADIEKMKLAGYRIFAGKIADDSEDISAIKELPPLAMIAFGSEGKGFSKEIAALSDKNFYIPLEKKAESLNVTAAAAISMYVFQKLKTRNAG